VPAFRFALNTGQPQRTAPTVRDKTSFFNSHKAVRFPGYNDVGEFIYSRIEVKLLDFQ